MNLENLLDSIPDSDLTLDLDFLAMLLEGSLMVVLEGFLVVVLEDFLAVVLEGFLVAALDFPVEEFLDSLAVALLVVRPT